MFLFSSRIRAIFIIALAMPLCSESFLTKPAIFRYLMACSLYSRSLEMCTKDYFPVCATNGRTYSNKCTFCLALKENGGKLNLVHYGEC
ncbi:ovomucoid-like [Phyllostomus hastatus]|uniref:ovomucoid-like n=1 Tax=Phyllostomus hastatus TaxID=9423 RepID=UPI001E67F57D|nr:ovomucoid-like [Phyllostomus hastatus]